MADITGGVVDAPQSVSTPKKEMNYGGGTAEDIGSEEMYNRFEASWTLGNWLTSEDNPRRGTQTALAWNWVLPIGGRPTRQRMSGEIFSGTDTTKGMTPRLYRREFFPKNDVHYGRDYGWYNTVPPTGEILAIEAQVFCINPISWNEGLVRAFQYAMYEYEVPLPPTMKIEYDEDTQELSFSVSSDIDLTDTSKNQERYCTIIDTLQRISSINGRRNVENYIRGSVNSGSDLTSKDYTFSTLQGGVKLFPSGSNASMRSSLSRDTDYVLYLFDSHNVGIRGHGPRSASYYRQKDQNTDTAYVFAIPPKATIASVTKVGEYVQVRLKSPVRNSLPEEIRNYDTPAIQTELQRAEATLTEFRQDPTALSWSSVSNAKGSADTVIFQESIQDAQNIERGKYTYYRIKTSRGDMPANYSEPVRSELYHKEPLSAVGAKISITGWKLSDNGDSVTLDLAWGIDDADQIEITYAQDDNAWDGYDPADENQQKVSVQVVDTPEDNAEYADNRGSFTITGLRANVTDSNHLIKPWFFRARRKREDNNTFGDFNDRGVKGAMTTVWPVAYIDSVDCTVIGMAYDNKNEIVRTTVSWGEGSGEQTHREGTQFEWSTTDDLSEHSTASTSTYDADDDLESAAARSVTLNIHDIDGGNTLRVRARRYFYNDSDGSKTYSTTYSDENTLAITAEDDIVSIIDISENGDGESLQIRLGWDEDDSDGTEISWSKKAYAWESSTAPSTFNVDWGGTLSGNPKYKYETTASIDGLEVGETYYIRARRYQEGTKTTYGSYTETLQAIPYSKPEDVVANAAEYHPRGKDLEVSWTFTSESDQTAYVIQQCVDDGSGLGTYAKADVIDSQNGDVNGVSIPADLVGKYAVDGVLRMIVTVATGGGSSDSDMLTVNVVDAPTCTVTMTDPNSIVRSVREIRFKMASSNEANRFVIQLVAHGGSLSIPDRLVSQSLGDILWTGEVRGSDLHWSDGVAEYVIPEELADSDEYLIDGSGYEVRVWAHDDFTGLSMDDPAVAQFTVQYDQMPQLMDQTTSIEIDDDELKATIMPKLISLAPSGTEIRIYRHGLRVDTMVAGGEIDGFVVTDRYVPFGNDADLYYGLMVKTPDGNVQNYRLLYALRKEMLRIDWGDGESVELPFNLAPTDTYSKNFEKRTYLDGSQNGYWGPGVTHTGTVTSAIFNVRDESDLTDPERERQRNILNQLRSLRRTTGAAFVRTSDGAAFEANVEVKKVDPKYDSLLYDISIEFNEVDTSSKFLADSDNPNVNVDEFEPPVAP